MSDIAILERKGHFNYDQLDCALADAARAASERIKSLHRRAIIECGRELLTIKEAMAHGHFTQWIEAEFGFAPTTARNYMRAAEAFGDKPATVAALPPGVLYTAASAPDVIKADIVRRAEAGENISRRDVSFAIDKHKQEVADAERLQAMSPEEREKESAERRRRRERQEKSRREDEDRNNLERDARTEAAKRLVEMLARYGLGRDELLSVNSLWSKCGAGEVAVQIKLADQPDKLRLALAFYEGFHAYYDVLNEWDRTEFERLKGAPDGVAQ